MPLVPRRARAALAGALSLLVAAGCHAQRGHSGGGASRPRLDAGELRRLDPADVALPPGYRIEVVASGFTFPTGVAFDAEGTPHVVEAGHPYGGFFTPPRLVHVGPGGERTGVAEGTRNGPWTGVTFHDGAFYVAEGGQLAGGRLLRIAPDGATRVVAEGLPSFGDHHTNGPAVGPDGLLYVGQGTATNSGVVGVDSFHLGWLVRRPEFHDVPCADVTLSGESYETDDPMGQGRVRTGPFLPFGTPAARGRVVRGEVPCSGAILRIRPDGGKLELVAWGLRNPFGLAFDPRGRLFVTENGYDVRGSRPVSGAPDVLWAVVPGAWYGWPEHAAGEPIEGERYAPPDEPPVRRVLAAMPGTPPQPAAVFAVSSSANGLDFSRSARFGHAGEAFVALFGDTNATTGNRVAPVGFKVVRVDPDSGGVADFAANRGERAGPASAIGSGGLERPVAVRFDPGSEALYVVDFGILSLEDGRPTPRPGTGVLWRVVRREPSP